MEMQESCRVNMYTQINRIKKKLAVRFKTGHDRRMLALIGRFDHWEFRTLIAAPLVILTSAITCTIGQNDQMQRLKVGQKNFNAQLNGAVHRKVVKAGVQYTNSTYSVKIGRPSMYYHASYVILWEWFVKHL